MSSQANRGNEADLVRRAFPANKQPAYEMTTVPAQRFIVDRSFQRHLTNSVVNAIKRDFLPAALGVIYATQRADENIVVIDGQHRIEAVLQLHYYDYPLPTLLYNDLDITQQAALFRFFNANRNRPMPLEMFRADIVARDPEAMGVQAICQEYAVEINFENVPSRSRPNLLTAIGTARMIYRRGGADRLREVLSILSSAWGDRMSGLSARYLKAVYMFTRRYADEYDREHLITTLRNTPMIALQRLGMTLGEEYSISAATAIARAIASNYNRGLRADQQLSEWGDTRGLGIPEHITAHLWTE